MTKKHKNISSNKHIKTDEKTVDILIKNHKDSKGGHPHGIMDEVDGNYVSVGFTHDKFKGKNHKNYALNLNPLGGNDKAYMHRQGTVDKKQNYHLSRKGKMAKEDYEKAKFYAEKAKNKYKGKKD